MSIQIQSGVLRNQRVTVAKIFCESFQDKFFLIFGDRKKAIRLISRVIREDRIPVAFKDGKAVGFAGLHYQGKNFITLKTTGVARIYGLATIRVLVYFLIMFFTELEPNQLHLEVLAVTKKQRNKGIGKQLLLSTIDFARTKKSLKSNLRL
jgi:GNAT superfamily N-acetyltransferase